MTTIEAFILGILQGLTEFLPLSSSGHLALAEYFLGFEETEQLIVFNVVCHLGTLLSIFCYFWKQLILIIRFDRMRIVQIGIATLPLFLIPFVIKPIKHMQTPPYIGLFFLITATLLFLCMRYGKTIEKAYTNRQNWKDPFLIGCMQAIAVLPGVSRSGSTISIARILGWDHFQAVMFSVLMAIPAILGAMTFEIYEVVKSSMPVQLFSPPFVIAFLTSFVVGFFALSLLMKLALKDRFSYFAWYCLILGVLTLTYSLTRF